MSVKLGTNSITKLYKGNTEIEKVYLGTNVIYQKSTPVSFTGLCFTAQQANSTVELTVVGTPSIANTAYSRDGTTWTTFTPSTTSGTNVVTLTNIGDKVYFKNDITAHISATNQMKFVMSGLISASGNCNSMCDATNYDTLTTLPYNYCFYKLFYGCTSLTTTPALPATTLKESCYAYIFQGCTSLTTPPALPSTTAARNCYNSMFSGCTSLTTAPALPATTTGQSCYYKMFEGCTSLTQAPELPSPTVGSSAYQSMFSGCTSLTTAPALPATTLNGLCYSSMFYGCTSLTTAPALPATNLTSDCYNSMFSGCTSLYVSDSIVTGTAEQAWNIPTSGTFINTTTRNQAGMFKNCQGTRSSDTMSGATGESHTYYTQNVPVS